jgi:hypothetical protein
MLGLYPDPTTGLQVLGHVVVLLMLVSRDITHSGSDQKTVIYGHLWVNVIPVHLFCFIKVEDTDSFVALMSFTQVYEFLS